MLEALDMVVGQRHPDTIIHHSDPECQYTSVTFSEYCRR